MVQSAEDQLLDSVPPENREPLKSALSLNMVDRGTVVSAAVDALYRSHGSRNTLSSGMYCEDIAERMGAHAYGCALKMLKVSLEHGAHDHKLIYAYVNHERERYLRAEVPARLRDPRLVSRVSDQHVRMSVDAAIAKGANLRDDIVTGTHKSKQRAKQERSQVAAPNVHVSGDNNLVHVGDGGTQSMVTYQQILEAAKEQINKSTATPEQKASALQKLGKWAGTTSVEVVKVIATAVTKHLLGGG